MVTTAGDAGTIAVAVAAVAVRAVGADAVGAAAIEAISALGAPHVGKGGLSAGPVAYWKSRASLLKKRSSPCSARSGKGSSCCSSRETFKDEKKE